MTADRPPQASGHVGHRRDAGHVNPNASASAPAPAPFDPVHAAARMRRAELRRLIDAAAVVFGVGAVESMLRLALAIAEDAWTLERAIDTLTDDIRRVGRQLDHALVDLDTACRYLDVTRADRDRARDVACALEAEIALHRSSSYAGRLEHQIRLLVIATNPDADPQPFIDRAQQEAAQLVARYEVQLVDTPGLPVVDDATLDEHQLVFRRDGTTVAVGRLDRLFEPLDTANEIALGATQEDGPPGGETVDVFGAGIGEEWLWPDSVLWQRPTELRPTWLLADAAPAEFVMVARPTCAEGAARSDIRRVDIGQEWACPACKEAPVPHPARPPGRTPGPADPPRPPHHQPFA